MRRKGAFFGFAFFWGGRGGGLPHHLMLIKITATRILPLCLFHYRFPIFPLGFPPPTHTFSHSFSLFWHLRHLTFCGVLIWRTLKCSSYCQQQWVGHGWRGKVAKGGLQRGVAKGVGRGLSRQMNCYKANGMPRRITSFDCQSRVDEISCMATAIIIIIRDHPHHYRHFPSTFEAKTCSWS